MSGGKGRRRSHNSQETKTIKAMDELNAYVEWKRDIMPRLQAMVQSGAKDTEIYEFARSYAAARMVTEALTNEDSAKALVALKDILDRTQGKAKERTEVEHRYSKLKDEELDALLESRLADLEPDEPVKKPAH